MSFLNINAGEKVVLDALEGVPEQVHLFEQKSIDAINAALAARRPLLIRGEPGVGKSQLARAAAKSLKRAYVSYVVDAHSESKDLLWHFDAVQRLADAQLGTALGETPEAVKEKLHIDNYLHPGSLWWAFNWQTAKDQAEALAQLPPYQFTGCTPENGCVLLIDEIDKAEADLPNGLLEALGERRFTPMGRKEPVNASEIFPLVIITTNEDRALPNAFLRRCLVLHLDLFDQKDTASTLIKRARAHFPELDEENVIQPAVTQLIADRATAKENQQQPLPGQAELFDLLRAVKNLSQQGKGTPEALIAKVAPYVMKKQAGAKE
jgi:MoxR-like ATPase